VLVNVDVQFDPPLITGRPRGGLAGKTSRRAPAEPLLKRFTYTFQ
jgi:hypothetical protein